MPAGSRRSRQDARHAGAWRWLPLALVVLAIVPLPGRSLSDARPASSTERGSAAATAVRYALDQLGKRYQWGGQGPNAFDCSGLTMMAYRSAGVTLPRVARWQHEVGRRVPLRQLAAGDLVFYARDPARADTIDHVGMYLGAARMVEAPNHTQPVRIASIWRRGLVRSAVRPAPASARMLGVDQEQRGPAVAVVQNRLRAAGACLAEDGSFGPATLAALQRFQRVHRLPADGVVGGATWGALVTNGRQRSRSPAC
jgi:hypothetical protein